MDEPGPGVARAGGIGFVGPQPDRMLVATARLRSPGASGGLIELQSVLKEIVEMPDQQADRVLRAIEQN